MELNHKSQNHAKTIVKLSTTAQNSLDSPLQLLGKPNWEALWPPRLETPKVSKSRTQHLRHLKLKQIGKTMKKSCFTAIPFLLQSVKVFLSSCQVCLGIVRPPQLLAERKLAPTWRTKTNKFAALDSRTELYS